MSRSDLFSYLSAFVTIVLAVAITDMVQSTHRLIRGRRRVRWDAVPLMFAGIVAATVVSEFFSLWATFDVDRISFAELMWIMVIPTLFALLAYSVLPDDVPQEGLDLRQFYVAERRTWVVIFGLATILDVVRSAVILSPNVEWLKQYAFHVALVLPPTLFALWLMWIGRSRRLDVAAVLLLAAVAGYGMLIWTISAKPNLSG